MTSESLYEVYHAACPFPHFGCDSFHADKAIAAYDDAKSVLDFGCGNGYAVKQMQSDGLNWIGVEVSQTAYEKHLQSPGNERNGNIAPHCTQKPGGSLTGRACMEAPEQRPPQQRPVEATAGPLSVSPSALAPTQWRSGSSPTDRRVPEAPEPAGSRPAPTST